MHAVARNITQRLAKYAPKEFSVTFEYGCVYYSMLQGEPATMEEFVEGKFLKYVNNDGTCTPAHSEEMKSIYEKAQALVHYSTFRIEK